MGYLDNIGSGIYYRAGSADPQHNEFVKGPTLAGGRNMEGKDQDGKQVMPSFEEYLEVDSDNMLSKGLELTRFFCS